MIGPRTWRWTPIRRAWTAVCVLLIIPIVLWAVAQPLDGRFATAAESLASLANITGLAGTAAFAVNVVIGCRIGAVVRLFGDPEEMYAVHRRLGAFALALLSAHAMLALGHAATDSAESVLAAFPPTADWAVFAGSVALAGMIAGLALTFFGQLKYESFIFVQRALGVTFVVAALHTFGVPGVRSSPPLLVYFSALTALAVLAFVYRSLLGLLLARRHRYSVASTNRLDASTTEIRLKPSGRALAFRPGQFIFVSFRSAATGPEPHPFSIASSPHGSTLDLVVKALGDYTTTLMEIPPGVRADIEGPYGSFSHLNVPRVRQVWIAGGIGVTPFLSMARSIEASSYEIDFYYCTEGAEHAHFFDELCEIADRNPRFRVVPVRKRSLGRISASDIVGVSRPVQNDAAILICGPPQMIQNLTEQFLETGVSPRPALLRGLQLSGTSRALERGRRKSPRI